MTGTPGTATPRSDAAASPSLPPSRVASPGVQQQQQQQHAARDAAGAGVAAHNPGASSPTSPALSTTSAFDLSASNGGLASQQNGYDSYDYGYGAFETPAAPGGQTSPPESVAVRRIPSDFVDPYVNVCSLLRLMLVQLHHAACTLTAVLVGFPDRQRSSNRISRRTCRARRTPALPLQIRATAPGGTMAPTAAAAYTSTQTTSLSCLRTCSTPLRRLLPSPCSRVAAVHHHPGRRQRPSNDRSLPRQTLPRDQAATPPIRSPASASFPMISSVHLPR